MLEEDGSSQCRHITKTLGRERGEEDRQGCHVYGRPLMVVIRHRHDNDSAMIIIRIVRQTGERPYTLTSISLASCYRAADAPATANSAQWCW